jgi:hypothetical protein
MALPSLHAIRTRDWIEAVDYGVAAEGVPELECFGAGAAG